MGHILVFFPIVEETISYFLYKKKKCRYAPTVEVSSALTMIRFHYLDFVDGFT